MRNEQSNQQTNKYKQTRKKEKKKEKKERKKRGKNKQTNKQTNNNNNNNNNIGEKRRDYAIITRKASLINILMKMTKIMAKTKTIAIATLPHQKLTPSLPRPVQFPG